MVYKKLGELLVGGGYISEEDLKRALEIQKHSGGKKLGDVLIESGILRQRQLYEALEHQLNIKFIDLNGISIPKEMAKWVPRSLAKKHQLVPLGENNGVLSVAVSDPLNFVAIDAVRMASHQKIAPVLATNEAITRAIADLYGSESAEKALRELKTTSDDTPFVNIQDVVAANIIGADDENTAPTIRLVNSILEYAVNQNCSDIHLEPRETAMAVRMRIDGVLRQVFTVPRGTQNAIIARVKVMGNMNVSEHKIPLDGRSNVRIADKDVDLRISTLPTVYGEKVVIRLLNKSSELFHAGGLGLEGKNLEKFNALLENANGVILIVGPTGSGKSSSMYTMINKLNTEQVNLVTLEDPVEYNFDGVNQVQINEKTGMTFAAGLRAILRQDPDIIAIGEIRDSETADIAMRAAITGHLVLSTLHTNDAPSTLDRLLDMGVENYLIASALKGVVSQRLVRRICPNCRQEYEATAEEQQMLRLPVVRGRRFCRGTGCPMCFGTGYRGRTATFEILVLNSEIRQAIADRVSHSKLMELIGKTDFTPMIDDCVRLVEAGITTADEAYRVVNSTDL